MTNLVISPPNLKFIDKMLDRSPDSHYFIGVTGFSICHHLTLNISEIKSLFKKHPNLKLFIDLNTLISNKELTKLKQILIELNKLPILGICFEDMAILQLSKKLGLNTPLYAAGAHQITSSNLINELVKDGAKGAKISNDINLEDIKSISKNTNTILLLDICKKERLFLSLRPLINNYANTINKSLIKNTYHIKNNDNNYEIITDSGFTYILHNQILNLIEEINELKKLGINYLFINSYKLDNFDTIIKNYSLAFNNQSYTNPLPKYTGSIYDKLNFKVVK